MGAAGDPAESAADRFAERVLRQIDSARSARQHGDAVAETASASGESSSASRIRRADAIRGSAGDHALEATVGPDGGAAPPDVARAIRAQAGRGEPLEPVLRSRIERAANVDLGGVAIHRDSQQAPRIQARAFTVGSDIHFAKGEYDPSSAGGVRLIAHEVAHVVQQRSGSAEANRTIRRAPLTSAAVLKAVDDLDPALKGHLDGPMPGEDAQGTTIETIRDHVTKSVDMYLKNSVGDDVRDNAVMLSIVIDGIAGVVSDALYDPWIRPKLATRLLDLYKSDLNEGLTGTTATTKEKDDARHTTALAGVLLTNDPIGLFMHGELPEQEAARRIVLMSKDAQGALNDYGPTTTTKLSADEMFTMLRRRFEAQMLAYTQSAVMRREDLGRDSGTKKTSATRNPDNSVDSKQATAYSTRESTDNVSVRYFNSLFGTTDPKAVTDFTATAKKQLDDLGTTVSKTTADWGPGQVGPTPRDSSLTSGQEQVLQNIEKKDATINRPNVIAALEQYAVNTLEYSASKATKAVAAIITKLDNFPITVTMPGSAVFEAKVPKGADTEYKAATVQQRVTTGAEKLGRGDDVFHHIGAFENPLFKDDRGDRYLQFRIWKDRMMSGNSGLSPEEMPKFGALNVDWETNWSSAFQNEPGKSRKAIDGMTESDLRNKKFSKMSLEQKKERVKSHAIGENYYGDVHMVLKNSIRQQNRVVFTCTDHGAPHRDALYAVYDALGGSFITNLKSGEQSKVLLSVFNESSTAPINKLTSMLMIEAQIYGKLDMATDVEQMVIAPFVHPDVKKNAKAFCKKHKITYVELDPKDPKITGAVLGDLKAKDLKTLDF